MHPVINVFAGARGPERHMTQSFEVGQALAKAGAGVVFGGGGKGSMGALADGFLTSGPPERLLGVMPHSLARPELKHTHAPILSVATMEERKSIFWSKSDGYLCLPGGLGSMDELFEALCLTKLGFIPVRPIVVLNSDGWFDWLRLGIIAMEQDGYIDDKRASLLQFANTISEALALLGLGETNGG